MRRNSSMSAEVVKGGGGWEYQPLITLFSEIPVPQLQWSSLIAILLYYQPILSPNHSGIRLLAVLLIKCFFSTSLISNLFVSKTRVANERILLIYMKSPNGASSM